MTHHLTSSLTTVQQRQQAVDALRMIESTLDSSRTAIDLTSVPFSLSESFAQEFEQLNKKSVSEKRSFVQDKIKELIQLKVIHLTTAIDPSVQMLTRMHRAFLTALNIPICLEITVDPTILGGVSYSLDGETKFWTIAEQLADVLAKEQV